MRKLSTKYVLWCSYLHVSRVCQLLKFLNLWAYSCYQICKLSATVSLNTFSVFCSPLRTPITNMLDHLKLSNSYTIYWRVVHVYQYLCFILYSLYAMSSNLIIFHSAMSNQLLILFSFLFILDTRVCITRSSILFNLSMFKLSLLPWT